MKKTKKSEPKKTTKKCSSSVRVPVTGTMALKPISEVIAKVVTTGYSPIREYVENPHRYTRPFPRT